MDNLNAKDRSRVMRAVKSKNTKPELKVRSFLHRRGLRYKLYDPKLPGKPDLVFPKYKTVLFVNGCFWHGHKDQLCKLARTPKSNVDFWENKVLTNQKRDKRNTQQLKDLGWNVLVIWECQINNLEYLESIERKIRTSKFSE